MFHKQIQDGYDENEPQTQDYFDPHGSVSWGNDSRGGFLTHDESQKHVD